MDRAYLDIFLAGTAFPAEDRAELHRALDLLSPEQEAALDGAVAAYRESGFDTGVLECRLEAMNCPVPLYTRWLLALIECSRENYDRWEDRELFFATFSDLRYKAAECRENYGVCGTFVGGWYPIFFRDEIRKLGRLEFELRTYPGSAPVCVGGYTVQPGDFALSIHIPASFEPFDRESRMDAYRRAYHYFHCGERGVPLVCYCESWLLYPPYTAALPEGSHIRDFAGDFCRIEREESDVFYDAWRVYGPRHKDPVTDWPEVTTLQRVLKAHFLAGGTAGNGFGLLVFDGEKLYGAKEAE